MEIGLETLQLVIFTNFLDISDKLKLAQELSRVKNISLDGEPVVLPLPSDVPLEIPRIILKNKDGSHAVNIAPSRTDITIKDNKSTKSGIPQTKLEEIGKLAIPIAIEIYGVLSQKFSAKVPRAAIVVRSVIKLNKDSKKYLQETLFKEIKGNPYEIKASILFKEDLGSLKTNKWINFESLRNKDNPEDTTALGVAVDINTLQEVDNSFSNKSLLTFYSDAYKRATTEIQKFAKI